MGKHIVGKETRKEGRERARIYTIIECDACRTRTYERKQRKIQEALKRLCKNCIATAAVERGEQERLQRALVRTQREQDLGCVPWSGVKPEICDLIGDQ